MIRFAVISVFLIVSVGLVLSAFFLGAGPETPVGTLLINLGTEIFGILITVAVVEWFLDRRRRQDRARELAWGVLHSLERFIWVWQGGPRQMGPEELLGVVAGIDRSDPLDEVALGLLVGLGSRARETLDTESGAVRTLPGLSPALKDLTSLRSLTEGGSGVSIRMVAEILESTTSGVAEILGLPCQRLPAALIPYRDSSLEAQRERFLEARSDGAGYPRPGEPRAG